MLDYNEVLVYCREHNLKMDITNFMLHESENPYWRDEVVNYATTDTTRTAICPYCGVESNEKWNDSVFICRTCNEIDPFLGFNLFSPVPTKTKQTLNYSMYRADLTHDTDKDWEEKEMPCLTE